MAVLARPLGTVHPEGKVGAAVSHDVVFMLLLELHCDEPVDIVVHEAKVAEALETFFAIDPRRHPPLAA